MRWPLRLQIMLPMAAIMLLTVLVVGGLEAYLSAHAAKARISGQIAGVVQILEQSNFPLTNAVLRQMKALSGMNSCWLTRPAIFVRLAAERASQASFAIRAERKQCY